MQPSSSSSRARSRSWGAGPWTTTPLPLSPRPIKPRHERSRSTTSTSTYAPLVSQQQGQAGGDANGSVTTEQQEAVVAVVAQPDESVVPSTTPVDMEEPPRASDGGAANKERVRLLEREAASAKQREMKMLESLVQQTKELEQAKIALEEARLEVTTLRQQQGQGEGTTATAEPAQTPQQQWSVMDLMFGGVDEELQGQLSAAKKERDIPLVEKWRREDAQGKLSAAFLDTGRLVQGGRKERMFASLSNLAELKSAAAAAAAMDDYGYEFDHLDVAGQYCDDATEHAGTKQHKIKQRRSILRKFGDLFRRRSIYKPNLAPVLHNHY